MSQNDKARCFSLQQEPELHLQMVLNVDNVRQINITTVEVLCLQKAFQYVNDNLLRNKMKNGTVFERDIEGGTFLFICHANGRKKGRFWH